MKLDWHLNKTFIGNVIMFILIVNENRLKIDFLLTFRSIINVKESQTHKKF